MKTYKKRIRLPSTRGQKKTTASKNVGELPAVILPEIGESKVQSFASRSELEPDAERNRSAFHLYLREIGESKLLTPKEEAALAKRIKKGDKKAREEMIK